MNTRFTFTYACKFGQSRTQSAFKSKTFKENMNKLCTNLKKYMK